MLKKTVHKTKETCKVTFELEKAVEKQLGKRITRVALVGDFNNWDNNATLMKKVKGGSWRVHINLKKGQEYQFRYLINNKIWENDWQADKYVANNVDGDNSVVVVPETV